MKNEMQCVIHMNGCVKFVLKWVFVWRFLLGSLLVLFGVVGWRFGAKESVWMRVYVLVVENKCFGDVRKHRKKTSKKTKNIHRLEFFSVMQRNASPIDREKC